MQNLRDRSMEVVEMIVRDDGSIPLTIVKTYFKGRPRMLHGTFAWLSMLHPATVQVAGKTTIQWILTLSQFCILRNPYMCQAE